MFVQYFGNVPRSIAALEPLLERLTEQLQPWAEGAYRGAEALQMKIGPESEWSFTAKTVDISVGRPVRSAGVIRVPLSWVATGTPGLFPKMEAELVVGPIGPGLTQVKFEGSYEPPLGAVGRLLDRALLHRIAESSIKEFVDRVIDALSPTPGT